MSARRAAGIAVSACLFLAVAGGCGGGGGDSSTASTPASRLSTGEVPLEVATKANANCAAMIRSAKALAAGPARLGSGRYKGNLDQVTLGFIRPGIPIFERLGEQQRSLEAQAHNEHFARYVELFDPTIVLAQEWLQSTHGARVFDKTELLRLSGLLTQVTTEQRQDAKAAGLDGCTVNFGDIVTSSYR